MNSWEGLFTMLKIVVLLFVIVGCARADENSTDTGNRQKRAMLFYDDDGHLMKSFVSPYLQQLANYAASKPEHADFLQYFFDFLRPLIANNAAAAFMIPVSENVVQQINNDPIYQHRLTVSKRGPEYNPLCVGRRTQIPTPKACNRFLSCWDGWAYELHCPVGLMFSNEGYCDYASLVQCKDRAVAIPNPVMPSCKTDFETFRNEWNCNEFFVCVNRQPVRFQCPSDLAYNEQFGVCDYPSLVDCSNSIPPSFLRPTRPLSTTRPQYGDGPSFPQPPESNQPSFPRPPPPGPTIKPIFPQDSQAPGADSSPQLPEGNLPSFPQPTRPDATIKPLFPQESEASGSQPSSQMPESNQPPFPQPILPGSTMIPQVPGNAPGFEYNPPQTDGNQPMAPRPTRPGSTTQFGEGPGFQFNPQLSDGNAIFMQNSVYNSHTFTAPVAVMSPQDAVRYLKLNKSS